MKYLGFLRRLEAPMVSPPGVLLTAGRGGWRRTMTRSSLRFLAHHFPCSQTEMLHNLCGTSWSAEPTRSYHQRAYEKHLVTEESAVDFSSTNGIIQPTSHAEMIKQYFDVSRTTAYRMLEKDKRLRECDVYTLSRNMNTLQENCVNPTDVRKFMALLYRHSLTTEHNIAAMKELGLNNLTAEHLIQSARIFKSSVALIKRWGLLPADHDPIETLTSLGVPDHVIDNVELSDIDNQTLAQVHQELSRVFLSWRLNCDREEVHKLQQRYKLNKKSMKLQQKVLTQLEHEWNIHIPKIQQNGYLLGCSPVNVAFIDTEVNQIAGVSVKEYALMTPRILTIPYHQLLQVDSVLSKLQLSQESLKCLPRICTLHPDTLQERINHLQQIPEFVALQSHPRMLQLIYYHKKTTIVNVQRNLVTLRKLGFTEEQLVAGLDVVLYSPELLADQLAQLPQRPQVQPFSLFKSDINVLQMLLYFMEKNVSVMR
ncbi:Transcription termination factor 5, mitochondrial [Chionoecetes opilio]|uniref:Transcription termination factor 5, mitochondrial n=1 Tax=Chionoecetes opilio TaxID=41210 RepID=A0A8J4Y3A4_CHIOP|nr:Transcription termination factor 5, mitochondrial [Chionoecetes opilio]